MGVRVFLAAAHARAMKALLPPSSMWDLIPTGTLSAIFLAASDELERVSGRAADMIEEADSSTTTELLPDFERELALPSTGSDAERRARIVALEIRFQQSRPADIQVALAPYFDLDAVDVEVIETSRATAILVGDDKEIYRYHVYGDPALPSAGGAKDLDAAQVALDTIGHSHTLGKVIESKTLKCDEATSLCDRDILGT